MSAKTANSSGRIANAIIIPMIAIVVLAVACVSGLMIWSGHVSDSNALKSQRTLLRGALELMQKQISQQQQATAIWDNAYFKSLPESFEYDWLYRNVGEWLHMSYGLTRTVVIGQDGEPSLVYPSFSKRNWASEQVLFELKPAIAKTRARNLQRYEETYSGLFVYKTSHRRQEDQNAEGGVVRIGGELFLYNATPITPEAHTITVNRSMPSVLISFKRIDAETIQELSSMSGLDKLALKEEVMEHDLLATLDLISFSNDVIGTFEWRANLPGTEMLNRVAPVLLILALAIAGLTVGVIEFTRNSTQRLARSREQAIHTSRHDSLSGLPNREYFSELLVDTLKQGKEDAFNTAVVYIDLDHFKDINDTLGHAAGDKVIIEVAKRIKDVLPPNGQIARISGDEFAMFLPHCDSQEWAEHVLTRVQDTLLRPIRANGNDIHASLSIGAVIAPRDGNELDELVRKADIALYDAKESGRGRWSFFDPSMQQHVLARDRMSRELRNAIDNDELNIVYQPQSAPEADRIIAVEALARWHHPELGEIRPTSFIPLAEETGLINDLGLWVLERACRDADKWPNIVISVNVSANQFKHPRFVEKVMELLERHNLAPERLELEVTESVFAGRHKSILTSLRRLKDLGIKVALDDFGTGYSSLSYLRQFPFDTLKIDRDFIFNLDESDEACAILRTIIQLGQALNLAIVAEGIETISQFNFVAKNGCDRMQGYLISRPLPADDISDFIEDYAMESAIALQRKEGALKTLQTLSRTALPTAAKV